MSRVLPNPDEMAALLAIRSAFFRLKSQGWKDAGLAPADSSPLELISATAPGITLGFRDSVGFWIQDEPDAWIYPIAFRPVEDPKR